MKGCPTCGRPFQRAGRTCASCDKPIKKHHKWHIDGSVVRHDNCLNPEMKLPEEGPLLQNVDESSSTQDQPRRSDG